MKLKWNLKAANLTDSLCVVVRRYLPGSLFIFSTSYLALGCYGIASVKETTATSIVRKFQRAGLSVPEKIIPTTASGACDDTCQGAIKDIFSSADAGYVRESGFGASPERTQALWNELANTANSKWNDWLVNTASDYEQAGNTIKVGQYTALQLTNMWTTTGTTAGSTGWCLGCPGS